MDDPMHSGIPMRGRWCDEHGRWECTKNRKAGRGPCHSLSIAGLDSCRMHGGRSGEVLKAQGAAITEWSALAGAPTVTTTEAVMGMLQVSWLRAHLYAGLLEQQFADAQAARGQAADEARDLTADSDEDGSVRQADVGPGAGLIGFTRAGVKDLGIFATGEAIRGLAQLEAAERDRVVKFAKVAHDMGIADAQVRIMDDYASQMTGLISRILDGLELTPEQRALVPVVVPRELLRVAG